MASDDDTDDADQQTKSLTKSVTSLGTASKTFSKSLTSGFAQAIVQGKNLDQVLQGIGKTLETATLKAALTPVSTAIGSGLDSIFSGLTNSLTGAFKSALGFRAGGVFDGGRVQPFASGGVVSSPTYFPLSGATGLMGEAGAEAIMPLRRGPDGKLGVAAGSGQTPINVTFNVATPDTQGFARSEAQITSLLARAVGRGRRGL